MIVVRLAGTVRSDDVVLLPAVGGGKSQTIGACEAVGESCPILKRVQKSHKNEESLNASQRNRAALNCDRVERRKTCYFFLLAFVVCFKRKSIATFPQWRVKPPLTRLCCSCVKFSRLRDVIQHVRHFNHESYLNQTTVFQLLGKRGNKTECKTVKMHPIKAVGVIPVS